jgi:hypothetical protein
MVIISHLIKPVLASLGIGGIVMLAGHLVAPESIAAAPSIEPVRVKPTVSAEELASPDADVLVSEILAQPLFSPSRQPADAANPTETPEPTKEPPKLPGRLEGMAIRPGAREALFDREGDKPLVVKEGQTIDGWTIASIGPDRVVLRGPAGEQIMKPAGGTAIKPKPIQAMNKKSSTAKKSNVRRIAANGAKPQTNGAGQQPQRLIEPIPSERR